MAIQVASRTIEVTILSAENLRLDRKPIKKNAFVIIPTELNNNFERITTEIDKEGGSYPKWNNEKKVIDLPMQAHHITVEVRCKTTSGNRLIGTARVPVTDFLGGFLPDGYLNFLSYRLRDYRGQRNGIINISVKVPSQLDRSIYSNSQNRVGLSNSYGIDGAVVTGVPVRWSAN